MSTSTDSHSTICLPAHILDAHITPRAREVLMLLASQTSIEGPALWICQATIAARLRCSPATVARAIQKLIEAKLIAETGLLHQGRYKFYHVRWSGDENIKAVSKKITTPIRKVVQPKTPPVELVDEVLSLEQSCTLPSSPPSAPAPTITPQAILKDSRIAYYAEIARKRHQESERLHQSMLQSLR